MDGSIVEWHILDSMISTVLRKAEERVGNSVFLRISLLFFAEAFRITDLLSISEAARNFLTQF
jgi:hypothetical protein